MMCFTISTNKAGSVNCEHDMKTLKCDIVDEIVDRSLQECGIDRNNRLVS